MCMEIIIFHQVLTFNKICTVQIAKLKISKWTTFLFQDSWLSYLFCSSDLNTGVKAPASSEV